MTSSKNKIPHAALSWFFLLYFIILFAERLNSLLRAAVTNRFFEDAFESTANVVVLGSWLAAGLLLAFFCKPFWRSLFSSAEPDYSMMSLTAGVALVSGMVHTEYTVPGIQFASYGMLIVAMILRVIQLAPESKDRFGMWYSLVYLTSFSMAIPVVYKHYTLAHPALFHGTEYTVTALLVISFTVMLKRLFSGEGENLLLWSPFAVMAIGDAVVIWMGWSAEVNMFVLIFAALTAVLFIAGKVIFALRKSKTAAKP